MNYFSPLFQSAYSYYLRHKSCFNEADLLDELPETLREALVKDVYAAEINRIHLFRYYNISFVVDIVSHLKPFRAYAGEKIFDAHDVVNEIIFITNGVVQLSISRGYKEVVFGFASEGGYFGDLGYYSSGLHVGNKTAVTLCHLLAMDTTLLEDVLCSHPEAAARFQDEICVRYDNFLACRMSPDRSLPSGVIRKRELWVDGNVCDDKSLPTFVKDALHGFDSDGRALGIGNSLRNNAQRVIRPVSFFASFSRVMARSSQLRMDMFKAGIIDPHGNLKTLWNLVIVLTIVFTVVTVPIELAFLPSSEDFFLIWAGLVINILFAIDMVLSSRTAFVDVKTEDVVTDARIIRGRYFRKWFLFDILTAIPIDFLLYCFAHENYIHYKAFKILKMLRFFRLIRIGEVQSFISFAFEELGVHQSIVKILFLLCRVLFFGHMICCSWWFISDLMTSETWFDYYGFRDAPLKDRYIFSLYWTFTTLSTVGYGDISAKNTPERLFNCLIMLLGGTMFGYIVASVSALLGNIDASDVKINTYVSKVRSMSQRLLMFVI